MKYSEMTPEQKTKRNKQNAKATKEYQQRSYDNIGLRVRKDGADGLTAAEIRDAATAAGQSVNGFILDAIRGRICSGAPAAGSMVLSLGNDGPDLEQIRRAAEREGLSMQEFVVYCIRDKI